MANLKSVILKLCYLLSVIKVNDLLLCLDCSKDENEKKVKWKLQNNFYQGKPNLLYYLIINYKN